VEPTNGTLAEEDESVAVRSTTGDFKEKDDEDLYFAPENNNVIFSSAIDGWAFTVRQFAALYEKKLGIKRAVLEKVLWGDFYLDPRTKRVLAQKHLRAELSNLCSFNWFWRTSGLFTKPLWAVRKERGAWFRS
jgi:ribosome assembly protein 1